MNESIRAFYLSHYPEDELGKEVSDISFLELFEIMDSYKDVYPYLADDSIIRERIFLQLSKVMEVDYDYVYEQWLKCH